MSEIKTIHTDKAFKPVAAYSQAKVIPSTSSLIFVSGQVPVPPSGDPVRGSIADQTKACVDNLKAILEEAGSGLDKIVKNNIYLSSLDHFQGFNEEYGKHFPNRPARTTVAVAGLPMGVDIEIECTAITG
ncbi:hypothetical protein MMC10_004078 [Thelotrema lepadinum]|nr:hypothetical protein [Thelotrema lepadinum]